MVDPLKAGGRAGAQRIRQHENGSGQNDDEENLDREVGTLTIPAIAQLEQYDEKEEQ